MATSLVPAHTFVARASSAPNHRRKTVTTSAGGGGKWWAPLFGWSAEADYIDSSKEESNHDQDQLKSENNHHNNNNASKSRFSRGCFTEEKARQLRMMTKDTASFHDAMYHSAIASRLASDFSDHPRQ